MQHDLKEKVVDFNKIDIHEAKERYEKAMNSSEKYWKVASKELSDLFGEVVSIVPPEGYDGQDAAGQRTGAAAGKAADKRRKDAAVAAAGRKEMLLHRIRSEPAILLVDPAVPPEALPGSADTSGEDKRELHSDSREAFATFLQGIESAGGIASADWKEKINAELDDEEGGLALKQTFNSIGKQPPKATYDIVPSADHLSSPSASAEQDPRRCVLETLFLPLAADRGGRGTSAGDTRRCSSTGGR
jgi:hypothetical protein